MHLWSAFATWIWNNLYLAIAITALATLGCIAIARTGEASFFAMCAGTFLMMKAEGDRPDDPPSGGH